ncbi:MAG: TlpA family protein disulfide reductase [Flavobacteriales bacterium]|nr:TlpA family protein disulfide reductase [Flavobacteriales bacterium]
MRYLWIFIVLIGACSSPTGPDEQAIGTEAGQLAPPIISTTISGESFDLYALKGDFILLDFWGSWCGPCIREAPQIVALHNDFKDKGLTIVSIAIEKNDKNVAKAARQLGYVWENQLVEESRYVRFNPIASAYDVTEIPSLFLIDPEGKITLSKTTIAEVREKLTASL